MENLYKFTASEIRNKISKGELKAEDVVRQTFERIEKIDGKVGSFVYLRKEKAIEEAKKLGIDIVAKEGYGEGDKDFRPQLTKIAATNPDVLLIPDYYEQAALITTQARELGMKSQFIGPDGWDGVAKALDSSSYGAIEGSYFTNHYSLDDKSEKVQNFLKAYREKYGEDPSAFSALSYDAAYLMKDAIEKAGSTEKDQIIEALKNSNFNGVTGHLTFDEKNNPIKAVTVLKIVNGKYKYDTVIQ